ncbi:MAG: hypothetical protein A3I61_14930 [Acidobacteria bacterium RIFCSPLOWO2_02_FULL_68_18]|nr:MAG: hypothetical protein A3I61_14930 [Acidobacteria bacterium RIFCSPLOWO2_02_FULL_68_18]OFW50403.1 MAG: hypothetical protein A3G77_07895 [Acidobacteria bacterium RIFCSPLOWO2_12_FULL_68_19]
MGASGQAAAVRSPRTPDGKPNLNGIWQALNEAYWDIEPHAASPGPVPVLGAAGAVPPGLGIIEGGRLPYQPPAAEQRRKNLENRLALDPEIRCYLPGVPRAMYMPYPFQIVQSPQFVMMVFTFARAVRTLYMTDHTEAPADSWMGWSNGRWDGDTLVVDTTGFNGKTWFDRSGNFSSDALHVVERFTMTDPDHLRYEATIEDPKVFTRPWTIAMPLYRRLEPNAQLLDFRCVEFAEDLIYGHLRKQPAP